MPEEPIRPDDENRLGRLSKNSAFLMMMVLMLLLAVQFVKGTDQTVQEITFTAFRSQLNSGNIHEVTVIDRRIEGVEHLAKQRKRGAPLLTRQKDARLIAHREQLDGGLRMRRVLNLGGVGSHMASVSDQEFRVRAKLNAITILE